MHQFCPPCGVAANHPTLPQQPQPPHLPHLPRLSLALAVLGLLCAFGSACSHAPPPPHSPPTGLHAPPAPPLAAPPAGASAPAAQAAAPPAANPATSRPTSANPHALPVDLWDRMRQGFALPALSGAGAQRVELAAQRYARAGLLQRNIGRVQPYLYAFVHEASKRGLPLELALLPYVESPLSQRTRAPLGACQSMPVAGVPTEQSPAAWAEQRREVLRCVRSVLDELSQIQAHFGDWHLTLAAYNWGEAALARAVQKNRNAGLPTAYENLRLPLETQNHVTALLGLAALVSEPAAYGIKLPNLLDLPPQVMLALPLDTQAQHAPHLAQAPGKAQSPRLLML